MTRTPPAIVVLQVYKNYVSATLVWPRGHTERTGTFATSTQLLEWLHQEHFQEFDSEEWDPIVWTFRFPEIGPEERSTPPDLITH